MPDPKLPALPDRFIRVEPQEHTPIERTFRAFDSVLQRDVVLKLPGDEACASWTAPTRERLLREARALARVRHAAIAPIHWVEETASGPLLVVDPPSGEPLARRLAQGPMPQAEVVRLGLCIADALTHVHGCGIVHRAVGPSTILIRPDGTFELGSFTFAKEFGSPGTRSSLCHARRTEPLVAAWLPDWSAPEQLDGQAADARADVYALGATLLACLGEPDPGRAAPPGKIDRRLRDVLRNCVAPMRTARFPTMHAVIEALRHCESGPAGTPATPSRRRQFPVVAAAALAVAVGLGIAFRSGAGASPAAAPEVRAPASHDDDANRHAARYANRFELGYARVHGLFVGIGEAYDGVRYRRLRNPRPDVEAVARQLGDNDSAWKGAIRILPEQEATCDAILDELDRLQREARPEDAVLFWFSGHGVKDGSMFGLVAKDTSGDIARNANFVRREHLLNFLARCPAKHVLVVLDCCHAGAALGDDLDAMLQQPRSGPGDVAPVDDHRGSARQAWCSREILCSARADQVAQDGDLQSPFVEAFLAELRQPATDAVPLQHACYLASRIGQRLEHRAGTRFAPLQMAEIRQAAGQKGSFVFRLRRS